MAYHVGMEGQWIEYSDCPVCGGEKTVEETFSSGTIQEDVAKYKKGDRVKVLLSAQCKECKHVEAAPVTVL